MISLSLYLGGRESREDHRDAISFLADALSIRPELRLDWEEHSSDYSFFGRKEGSLFYGIIRGDFRYSIDVHLFGIAESALEPELLRLSSEGLVIAIPDEDSNCPFDYLLFESGRMRKVSIEVIEDQELEEVRILPTP